MSVSLSKSRDGSALILFRFPFRRVAVGLGLAIGLLVPVIFEMGRRPAARTRYARLEQLAILVAGVALCVSPIARYRLDKGKRTLRWWQVGLNGCHWGWTKLSGEPPLLDVRRFPFAKFGWYQVRVRGEPRSVVIPLSLSESASDRISDRLLESLGEPGSSGRTENERRSKRQISLRRIFVITTMAAAALGLGRLLGAENTAVLLCLFVFGIIAWTFALPVDARSRVQAMLAATYLPFAWVIAFNKPLGYTSRLYSSLPFAPGIIPVAFFMGGSVNRHVGFTFAFVVIELIAMVWLARRSVTAALWTLAVALAYSALSSLAFHLLFRM